MVTIISSQRFLFGFCFFFKKGVGSSVGSHSHRVKFTTVSRSRDPRVVMLALRASSFAQWAGAAQDSQGFLFAGAETEGRALAVTQGIAIFFLMPSKGIKKNCLNYLLSLSFPLKRGHFNLKKKKKNMFKHCENLSKWSDFPHFAGEA